MQIRDLRDAPAASLGIFLNPRWPAKMLKSLKSSVLVKNFIVTIMHNNGEKIHFRHQKIQ